MGECIIAKKTLLNTLTYTATTRSSSIDLGVYNKYRYLDTSGVPNSNSGTYTPTALDGSIDMGAANSYRYINTLSVPATYVNKSTWWGTASQRDLSYTAPIAGKYFILGCRYDPAGGSQSGMMENGSWLDWGNNGWYNYTRTVSAGTVWTYRCSANGAIFVVFRYGG